MTIRIGTRSSPLALIQADLVVQALAPFHDKVEIVPYTTQGDKIQKPLWEIGGRGLFTKELQEALLRKEIHGAVHSLKDVEYHDLPLLFGAFLPRENPSDVLVLHRDRANKDILTLGTCSPRRRLQMHMLYPKAVAVDLRGNVGSRVKRVTNGTLDGAILAYAGLQRLGYMVSPPPDVVMQPLPIDICVPAAGQGILVVECLAEYASLFAPIDHLPTRYSAHIERFFAACFHGNCQTAIGGYLHNPGLCSSLVFNNSAVDAFTLYGFYQGHYGTLTIPPYHTCMGANDVVADIPLALKEKIQEFSYTLSGVLTREQTTHQIL